VVYATSNKRDLVDLTQKARAKKGQVWVFDPQGIAGTGPPPFWCDPLDACGEIMGARVKVGSSAGAVAVLGRGRAQRLPRPRAVRTMVLSDRRLRPSLENNRFHRHLTSRATGSICSSVTLATA
jgi:hypothetical protein